MRGLLLLNRGPRVSRRMRSAPKPSDLSPSDDEDDEICPLCCETLDVTDKNFFPCPCGYQVRRQSLSSRVGRQDPTAASSWVWCCLGVPLLLEPHKEQP